jgi:hypothetical protein
MSFNVLTENPCVAAPVTSTPSNNDVPWHDYGTVVPTLTGAGAWNLTGIQAPVDNRPPLYILNHTGQNMTIKHNSGGSLVANRILHGSMAGGGDIIINDGGSVTLIYDRINNMWNVVGST